MSPTLKPFLHLFIIHLQQHRQLLIQRHRRIIGVILKYPFQRSDFFRMMKPSPFILPPLLSISQPSSNLSLGKIRFLRKFVNNVFQLRSSPSSFFGGLKVGLEVSALFICEEDNSFSTFGMKVGDLKHCCCCGGVGVGGWFLFFFFCLLLFVFDFFPVRCMVSWVLWLTAFCLCCRTRRGENKR